MDRIGSDSHCCVVGSVALFLALRRRRGHLRGIAGPLTGGSSPEVRHSLCVHVIEDVWIENLPT